METANRKRALLANQFRVCISSFSLAIPGDSARVVQTMLEPVTLSTLYPTLCVSEFSLAGLGPHAVGLCAYVCVFVYTAKCGRVPSPGV